MLWAADSGLDLYTKNCARCHELLPPLQTRALMKDMTPEHVWRSLTTGAMRKIGAPLNEDQRITLAEFVTEKKLNLHWANPSVCPANKIGTLSGPQWNGWGGDLENSRFQTNAGLSASQLPKLKLAWAFGFPGEFSNYSQPTVLGSRIFVGSPSGTVYSLDTRTGCTYWTFDAGAGVRSAITIGPDNVAYFGDVHANMFALNAMTGKQIWKNQVENYPSARITGAPKLYQGQLYVPVSSRDEWFASDSSFECCRFRGSVISLNAKTGLQQWKTYTISEEAKPLAKKKGTLTWGPSGAGVWNSPTIDEKAGVLYVGTGDSYSEPPTPMSDSILAISLSTGKIVWSKQLTPNDIFNGNCLEQNQSTCPEKVGPDADFAASPILHTGSDGRRILLAGQKSGILHALDPDQKGEVLWQTRLSTGGVLGGIQWGPAADRDTIYAAISDLGFMPAPEGLIPDPKTGGGIHAIQISTGEKLWSVMPAGPCERHRCSPAQSEAITAIPGAVFSGSLDGHIRAYSAKDGTVLWDYDTVKDFETVNKVPAKGGSLDGPGPVVAGGMLFVNSGYAYFNGMPGNVLLAFTPQ
jgi:polyvinyl alcohol dehydrogenase (cytochrome)